MNIFIASHSQEAARHLMERLNGEGYVVVARWIKNDSKFGHGIHSYTDSERAAIAEMDEADVRAADVLVLIAEAEGRTVPGGKHVETGIALALSKPVVVLGRRENIFHWHPRVAIVHSVEQLLQVLAQVASNPELSSR